MYMCWERSYCSNDYFWQKCIAQKKLPEVMDLQFTFKIELLDTQVSLLYEYPFSDTSIFKDFCVPTALVFKSMHSILST